MSFRGIIFHHTSRRDEGIPPYRTVNDGFIIMLQISPAATSPDSTHWARAVSYGMSRWIIVTS